MANSIFASSVKRLYKQSGFDKTIPKTAFQKNLITAQEYFDITGEQFTESLDNVKQAKILECDKACSAAIIAGCDATLTDGTVEHFAWTAEDQINIATAEKAIQGGAPSFPYHADNKLCRLYSAADIIKIITAATAHKTYHTTYFNHLKTWINRCTTVDEVNAITYGVTLPDDLLTSLNNIVEAMQQLLASENTPKDENTTNQENA